MQKSTVILRYLVAALTVGVTTSLLADPAMTPITPHWYAGASMLSNFRATGSDEELMVPIPSGSIMSVVDNYKDTISMGWALFGGYRASTHWAFELGYYDLGDFKRVHTLSLPTTPVTQINATEKAHNSMIAASTLFMQPVYDSGFSVYLRTGLGYHIQTDNSDIQTKDYNFADSGYHEETHFIYGFGGQYDMAHNLSARVEYTLYDADAILQNLNGGRATLSLVYNF